jgi:uncharacterized phage protein gp47/JayE
MQLQLQTFTNMLATATAAVQGSARQLVDLSVGSTLRAMLESSAAVGLWMQWLILQVLRTTRAATSEAGDLDTWVGDFGLSRLVAVPSYGSVTFSRFVPTASALIAAGTEVRTGDAAQTFAVVADTAHPAWSAAQSGFLLGAGQGDMTVPVTATVPGSAGNVQAGAISLIASALPGVDTVGNSAPLVGGLDAEGDAALRARFLNFMDSRSRATPVAVSYAITSVQQGLQYTLAENEAPDGSGRMGCFTLTIDDGSGAPPDSLLATVTAAVESVRPIGSSFSVRRPVMAAAQISLTIAVGDRMQLDAARQAVLAAVTGYVNALPIGAPLAWSRLTQIAYDAHPAVTNVRDVLVNGGTQDFVPGAAAVVKAAAVVVGC